MQEHGVQHHAGRRVQAEGNVRNTQGGPHPGVAALQFPDCLNGLDAVTPCLLLPSGDGEGQAVDEDIADVHPPGAGQLIDQARGHPQFPLGGPGLALLVYSQGHHGGTVLRDQRHHSPEPGRGTIPVLVVDRVDDAAAGEFLEARLKNLRLGGVQDHRQRDRGRQAPGKLLHVAAAVPADIVDAQVQHVRTIPGLALGDLDTVIGVPGQHRLTECLGTVRIGALPDAEVTEVLVERDLHVQR